jgi:ATP-dependent DNA helicase RecQ
MTSQLHLYPFAVVRERLLGRTSALAGTEMPPPFARLLEAMEQPTASPLDLAVLLRHALRCEAARSASSPAVLLAPGPRWLAASDWAACGITAEPRSDGLVLQATPWKPDWLPDVPPDGVDGAAAGETLRRGQLELAAPDPYLTGFGYRAGYRTEGQRVALRAALTTPVGATLVVSLPTGDGKSLVFQAIARHGFGGNDRGVTLVVTPTVALALDHEGNARRLGFGEGPFAYRGGESTTNNDLCLRIRAGTQAVCFASPEAVCSSQLRGALEVAGRDGLIRAIVIDEAHLIDSWGINFRPEFQVLSAVRRAWLAQSGINSAFRTILLSATLTADTIQTLKAIFPPDEGAPFKIVSAARLRPEIDYWVAPESPERLNWVMEALLHLPRPAILYTSERSHAYDWRRRLRERGFRRLGLVTGDSTSAEREVVINGWSRGEIDLVVGTSAFGLGIDNPHVRAVVHACVPETLDRFYQEVGRGGRDGHAAVSLILPSERDRGIARTINSERLLTIEKAEPRWRSMFTSRHARQESADIFQLPIDAQPGFDADRIDMVGPRNRGWNVRALVLLAAMGAIDLLDTDEELSRDAALTVDDNDDDRAPGQPEPTARARSSLKVRVRDTEHLTNAFWQRVQDYRDRRDAIARASLDRVLGYLKSDRCIAEILAPIYEVPVDLASGHAAISVALACGGCPACRRTGRAPFIREPEIPSHPWPPKAPAQQVSRLLEDGHLFVCLPEEGIQGAIARRNIRTALWRTIELGVHKVVVVGSASIDLLELEKREAPVSFVSDQLVGDLPPGPALILADPDARIPPAALSRRPPADGRIWLMLRQVRHPLYPDRSLCDQAPGRRLTLNEFVQEMLR